MSETNTVKVRVLRKVIHGQGIYAKKGDILELPAELAEAWLKAKHVEKVK